MIYYFYITGRMPELECWFLKSKNICHICFPCFFSIFLMEPNYVVQIFTIKSNKVTWLAYKPRHAYKYVASIDRMANLLPAQWVSTILLLFLLVWVLELACLSISCSLAQWRKATDSPKVPFPYLFSFWGTFLKWSRCFPLLQISPPMKHEGSLVTSLFKESLPLFYAVD